MDILGQIILGLVMGVVFGVGLEKSRVFEPGVIVGQFQLRNFLMLKIFIAAIVTGLLVLAVLNGGFGVALHPKALDWQANLVGGLILGAGIAIAGACPGTSLAQIGAGYRDAWFILAGAIAGAMAFGYLEPSITPLLAADAGVVTYANLFGVPFWALALIVAAALVVVLAVLERMRSWQDEVGEDVDGLAPQQGRPGQTAGAKTARA